MYGTQADLEARYTKERVAEVFCVQLPDGSTTGVADATSLNAAGADASAEIDEIASTVNVYPIPTPIPASVLAYWCALTMGIGIERRPELAGKDAYKPYAAACAAARKRLDDVRKGERRLIPTTAPLNAGGQIANDNPIAAQPFLFVADPTTGNGGFNDGGF